ncbi:pre-mRNA-splicing factor SYF1 [Quillaja saponaria]|uniref:Pre-mRNA-splicing factor SYF1 n=1 Tax=Quillaja saponaria TaxID=32244 RepID=A0AAD7KVL2_QUISA|nr:pre-mRNA-splicing factor SYF1 [Quillaja saponaria]
MELRQKNFEGALELTRRATEVPSVEVKRRVAADGNEPIQMNLDKSMRLWTFCVDLEESLGTLESTRAVYAKILDLRIATPQIIINYAVLLKEHKYFEDAFKVYERGVKIFKYPHVKDIWVTYLSKFVKRYGKNKLERGRELFEHAVETGPADAALQYVKLEEEHGLAKCVGEIFGVTKTREIYEQAIEYGLPDKDVKTMCMKYTELEKKLRRN